MTDQTNDAGEKKIIVDEDWKSKVEKEKEALRQKESPQPARPAPPQPPPGREPSPLPPASLSTLITSLSMEAMMALGLMAEPSSGKAEPRLDVAKHLIDTLQVLDEKTAGNRTEDESRLLEHMLHELRMGFVMIQERQAK